MVKSVKAMKLMWNKNDTGDGGAMAQSIKQAETDDVVVHTHTTKHGRMWTSVQPDMLLKLIQKNNGIYEVLYKFPHKVYFDIDCDKKNETLLNTIKQHITEYFPNADMAISGSISDAKTSYHIILQNYMIHNEDDRLRLKAIVTYLNKNKNSCFDWKVYNKNRNMKCINQSKPNKQIQSIIENDDYKAHCISCYIGDISLPMPINDTIEEEVLLIKSKKTFNLGLLPKLNLATPDTIDIYDCTPKQLLKLLPINKSCPHEYTHLIARFCYHNKINLKTFLSWYINKNDNNGAVNKWTNHWSNLDKFPAVSNERIITILSSFYPQIKKDLPYRLFKNTFKLPSNQIKKIETITQDCFEDESKYLLFNVGMGGGKTYQTIEYLKGEQGFLWIAPNVALSNNTLQRFEEKDMFNVKHYLNFTKKKKQNKEMEAAKKLIVVLNSLHYISNATYNVVVIDEIETLLDKLLGDFLEQDKLKLKKLIWETFIRIIKNASKVIFLDAFITSKTINFIKTLEENNTTTIFERVFEPHTRRVKIMSNYDIMLQEIITKLKKGNKIVLFYPYRDGNKTFPSMQALHNVIKLASGKSGIYYNSLVDDKIKGGLKNVNSSWKDKSFIICNNVVTCGVSYENIDVDYKYIMIGSYNVPRDIIQFSYRVRNLRSGIIKLTYLGTMNQPNSWLNDCAHINCPVYNKLYSDILIERKSPLKRSVQLFCCYAHYKLELDDVHMLDKMLTKQINDLFDEQEVGYTYDTIQDINASQSEDIQTLVCAQEATMYNKFQLKKYYFKLRFKDKTDTELNEIWNNNFEFFFLKLASIINDETSLFNKIKKHNELKTIFPVDVSKTKLTSQIIDEIFESFSFKYLNKNSSSKLILKEIYNNYFSKYIISTKLNKTTRVEYEVLEDAYKYYDYCLLNYKLDKPIDTLEPNDICLIED